MSFSIVIPLMKKNRRYLSINVELAVEDVEVIVVDHYSKDRTVDIIRTLPNVRFVQHVANQGPIIAINNGMKSASHEIFVTLLC